MRAGFIGSGNMARAIARGWGEPVLCSDGGSRRAEALAAELGGEALSNAEVAERSDVVVLCHKPHQLGVVAAELAGRAKAVVSVLGATSLVDLQEAYPGVPVVRLMPNTPVEVRRGVLCYCAPSSLDEAFEADVVALFERIGTVVKLPESQLGAATAVMGVGPAYQALLAEAQIDAAVRHGLPALLAAHLMTETMAGSAALIAHRGYDTLTVRREVSSPGGSTARGLAALESAGVRSAFQSAMDAVVLWTGR